MKDKMKFNKLPTIVLDFDELFEKMLDHKDKLSDFKNFRNKLLEISRKKIKKEQK